ncbi:MAG: hypothetical protein R3C45_17595 [Phycisphaerales bacterium]
MNRIETACFGLIASAFILAGLLIVQLASTPNTAEASLVITRDNFTLLTARTKNGEESLFIINNVTSRLLIYSLDLPGKSMELVGGADLKNLFVGGSSGGDDGRGRR